MLTGRFNFRCYAAVIALILGVFSGVGCSSDIAVGSGRLGEGAPDPGSEGSTDPRNQSQNTGNAIKFAGALEPGIISAHDQGGLVFNFETVLVAIDEVMIRLPKDVSCDDLETGTTATQYCHRNAVYLSGTVVADLVNGSQISNFPLPRGRYHRAKAHIGPASWNDIPHDSPVRDLTVYGAGTFEVGGELKQFKLRQRIGKSVGFFTRTGIELASGENLVLLMNVDRWLKDLNIAPCLADGRLTPEDGVIVLGTGCGTATLLKNAIKQSTDIAVEADGKIFPL